MKSKDLYNKIVDQLTNTYVVEEAKSVAEILIEEYFELNKMDLLVNKEIKYGQREKEKVSNALKRLQRNEPIQYVLGKAHFYGRDFKVNPNVLIPRRETEELVYLIRQDHPNFDGRILDIGTGSGCIPITLKLEILNAKVDALDISKAALLTAKQNSDDHAAEINFLEWDILSVDELPKTYDIIVSNPPYVMHKEKELMKENVLDNEPHLALFVEDDEPLIFYKAIIEKATKSLSKGGFLYFEINEQFGNEVTKAMKEATFQNVKIIKDMQGRDRMVKGEIFSEIRSLIG
jgi:release factor glutamine methyltransferase